jgi:polyisoprenoid-binding protein YceI
VLSGFTRFRLAERVELGRSDRQFYMDFNPWVSDNGELYLSVALFSQFHCKQPVYTHDQQPLRGPWPERERLFRQAAAAMEAAVVEQMAHSTSGDGFEPVPERIALLSWEQLGLSLPPRPAAATAAPVERPLPRRWRLAPVSADAPPHVAFRFAPPLEQYAGEARTVRADVYLDNNGGLASSRMRFEVDVASITMGDPELDEVLRGSTMLAAARHPTSSWVLDHTDGGAAPLRFGETTDAVLEGRFLLKGTTTPLTVRASFEPQVDADGRPRLLMQAAFQLDIKPFVLEVPDGPEPARSTVEFDIDLLLEPVEPKQTR